MVHGARIGWSISRLAASSSDKAAASRDRTAACGPSRRAHGAQVDERRRSGIRSARRAQTARALRTQCQEIGAAAASGSGIFGQLGFMTSGIVALGNCGKACPVRSFDVGDRCRICRCPRPQRTILTAVVVGVYDLAPDAHGVGMLLRSVDLDLHGRACRPCPAGTEPGRCSVVPCLVSPPRVVVPVSAERRVHAVRDCRVCRAPGRATCRSRARRGRLQRFEAGAAPPRRTSRSKPVCSADGHLQRPSEHAAVDELLDRCRQSCSVP